MIVTEHVLPTTLDRARQRLSIKSVRVHAGTPQQTNYWLLPGQKLTKEHGLSKDAIALDATFARLAEQWPRLMPLDENLNRRD